MGKETVRYPDPLVTRIEKLVANSDHFESKSEFHRFSSEFFLTLLDPDHDTSVLGYQEILQSLEADLGQQITPMGDRQGDADTSFLHAYIQVRHHLLHQEGEAARSYVTDTFDQADREALLLDELIAQYRHDAAAPSTRVPSSDDPAKPQQTDTPTQETQSEDRPDGTDSPPAERNERTAEDAEQEAETAPQGSTSLEQPPETG